MSDAAERDLSLEKRVGLTVSLFAVALAYISLVGSSARSGALTAKAEASNRWSHYQAKSIKQYIVEMEGAVLSGFAEGGAAPAAGEEALRAHVEKNRSEVARFDAEKAELRGQAERAESEISLGERRADLYDYAGLGLQLTLALGAVAIILDSAGLWYACIAMGLAACAVAARAHFLG